MNLDTAITFLSNEGAHFGLKLLGALAAWIVGRWLIGMAVKLLGIALQAGNKVDTTLTNYIKSIAGVVLTIGLVLAVLDIFGMQTTSFAALLAGAGLAIGTAWGGLLTHFAAGVFMQVLRPFKVGDAIAAGGVTGVVQELGLFGTTIITADNVLTIVGNNKIFSDNIQNFSALPYRRVDCTAKLAHGVDPLDAIARLRQSVTRIPNVLAEPAPVIDLIAISDQGPVLAVRPFAAPAHFGQVYFDTHRAVVQTFKEAGYPLPDAGTAAR